MTDKTITPISDAELDTLEAHSKEWASVGSNVVLRLIARLRASALPSYAEGKAVTLAECPIGLFRNSNGNLCLKTEYGNNEGRIDAYIVSSGEFFWGENPQTIANQRRQIVTPVDEAAIPPTAPSAAPNVSVPEELRTLSNAAMSGPWKSGADYLNGYGGEFATNKKFAIAAANFVRSLLAASPPAPSISPASDRVTGEGTHPYENFNAALDFALDECDAEGLTFLKVWREGDWRCLDEEWPEWKVYIEALLTPAPAREKGEG